MSAPSNFEQSLQALAELLTAKRDNECCGEATDADMAVPLDPEEVWQLEDGCADGALGSSWIACLSGGKPGIIISYLGGKPEESWYISLSEFVRTAQSSHPQKTVIFKGKFPSLCEGFKAAAKFLAPTKLEELKRRVQSLASKL